MKILSTIVSESIAGFKEMLFPEVCVCCGCPTPSDGNMLCPFCQGSAFDPANFYGNSSCPGVILPEGISFQYALWKYDKGGELQRMLHLIKYGGMGRLGFELGVLTGSSLVGTKFWSAYSSRDSVFLLPVPLHPKKKRIRGYNQAELVATGISEVTGIPLVAEHSVIRHRYTVTQTGFDLQGRLKNLSNAFKVDQIESIKDKLIIIVDDVFTTGATSYALARILKESGVKEMGIITVAFA